MYDSFEIAISKSAQPVDFNTLSPDERASLFRNTNFDPGTHDIFSFVVSPEVQPRVEASIRKAKLRSYSMADRVLIHTKMGSPQIQLFGIHPGTTRANGQVSFDFEGIPIIELGSRGLKSTPRFKNIRRDVYSVYASRFDEVAQWVFLEGWLRSGTPFCLAYLCAVPKDLDHSFRFVACNVRVEQGKREVKSVYAYKVRIPELLFGSGAIPPSGGTP